MNAPFPAPAITIDAVDLRDANVRARIDGYVRGHAEATPFHLSAWQIGVAKGCRQRAHCLIAEQGGALVGLLPLTEVRSLLFGRALISSGFAVGGGVLADSDRAASALVDAGWALAERRACPTMELRGGAHPGDGWSEDATTYVGFSRMLADSDEAELAAIPRKHRAEVRKGLAADLEMVAGSDAACRRAHYAVYADSVRNLGTPVFPSSLFAEILMQFGANADILVARQGAQPVASVMTLYFRNTAYPYWGGGSFAARALRANERLYFALMRHAHARGCTRFDFGRSKTGTGAAAYKHHWGFEPTPLRYFNRAAAGHAPRDVNPLSPRYQAKIAAWKKLPLWVANAAGPLIARGLG